MSFIDLFSQHAALYAVARPRYPKALFERIAAWSPARSRVWDCGTGNGQAAIGLAEHFETVCASDPSEQQVALASAHARVCYSVQAAEETDYPAASFDAICVAQALHWFDYDRFYPEAHRVLRPGGLFVAFGYDWFQLDPEFDGVFEATIVRAVEGLWAPEIARLWSGYREIPFPFDRLETPTFELTPSWTFVELMAYVHSWSAVQRRLRDSGPEFLERAAERLASCWGDPNERRTLRVPLHVVAGRHPEPSSEV